LWDISGLHRSTPNTQPGTFDMFDKFSTAKYILGGHNHNVNFIHLTLPLIVSADDDRQIKLWRLNETKAWEIDTCRGHFNNVFGAHFHPQQQHTLSIREDKT
ncbi:hypothetical protein JB92DRAFT_2620164, partial [Gautieria morchelliformis]